MRKSCRGCIISTAIVVLDFTIIQRGAQDIRGLTDEVVPRRLGPKRANKIRKLFNLTQGEDVRPHVIRRIIPHEDRKGQVTTSTKAPKVQRLVTPLRLQRKRAFLAWKRLKRERHQIEARDYNLVYEQRKREKQKFKTENKEAKRINKKRKEREAETDSRQKEQSKEKKN